MAPPPPARGYLLGTLSKTSEGTQFRAVYGLQCRNILGSRACIGRKFATVEAICFLTRFIRDWKVAPLLAPGETREQWRKRVLDAKVLLALGIERLPLTLERRKLA
ncbi:unnamed protein product [Mycena citricolor]|uniref:Cytochrome P450 n=1 Tax=Mycena citricolor TaxID=2018698 RepID=A0AAD2GQG0_9AGAR|nr:unnamed protein product [Mycena citricolor]